MKAEFGRILGIDKPVKMMVSNFQNFTSKILAFAESQPVAKDLISIMEEASVDSPSKKRGKKVIFTRQDTSLVRNET